MISLRNAGSTENVRSDETLVSNTAHASVLSRFVWQLSANIKNLNITLLDVICW